MSWRWWNKTRKGCNLIKHIIFRSTQLMLIYNFQRPRKQINIFWFISQTLMWVTRFLVILLWGGQPGDQTCSLFIYLFVCLFIYLFIYLWIIWRCHQLGLHSVVWLDSSWIINLKAREKKRSWPSFDILFQHLLRKNEVTDTRDPSHNVVSAEIQTHYLPNMSQKFHRTSQHVPFLIYPSYDLSTGYKLPERKDTYIMFISLIRSR